MAPWPFIFGVGVGLIATIIAIIAQRPQRAKCIPDTSFVTPPNDICPVCLFNMSNDEMSYLNCGHAIHHNCLLKLKDFSNKCPTCRQEI